MVQSAPISSSKFKFYLTVRLVRLLLAGTTAALFREPLRYKDVGIEVREFAKAGLFSFPSVKIKKRRPSGLLFQNLERAMRFELTTSTLARWRSTTELRPRR